MPPIGRCPYKKQPSSLVRQKGDEHTYRASTDPSPHGPDHPGGEGYSTTTTVLRRVGIRFMVLMIIRTPEACVK